jgi:hypothetical protein
MKSLNSCEIAPLYSEVNLDNIIVSKPIASTGSGRGPTTFNMFIGAPGRKPFRFQFSRAGEAHRNTLVFPPEEANNGSSRINLALSIQKGETDVFEFWQKVDDIIIPHVAKHSKEFLKREMTEVEVRAIYTPTIRSKEDYDSYLKARFDHAPDARCPVKMFDINEHKKRYSPLHHTRLEQGDSLTCIGQLGMVYFFNQKVGITVDISHLTRYAPPPANEFPFQLGAEYSRCAPEDLFAEDTNEIRQSYVSCNGVTVGDHPLEIAPIVVSNAAVGLTDVKDEDDSDCGEIDDGSTITIDPVTLMPVGTVKTWIASNRGKHNESSESEEDDTSKPRAAKRRR